MKILKLLMPALLIIGCQSKKAGVFKALADKQVVTIVLKNYHLDKVPADIGELSKAEYLTITYDSIGKGVVYPPLAEWSSRIDLEPFKTLPKELTELKKLKNLALYGLDIKKLPEDFEDLKNLEYLDLSMNKLTIAEEITTLKKLKNLKYLGILGNRIDTAAIISWRKENPNLRIDIGIESPQ